MSLNWKRAVHASRLSSLGYLCCWSHAGFLFDVGWIWGKEGLLVGVCGPACYSGPMAASSCAGVGGDVPSWAAFVFQSLPCASGVAALQVISGAEMELQLQGDMWGHRGISGLCLQGLAVFWVLRGRGGSGTLCGAARLAKRVAGCRAPQLGARTEVGQPCRACLSEAIKKRCVWCPWDAFLHGAGRAGKEPVLCTALRSWCIHTAVSRALPAQGAPYFLDFVLEPYCGRPSFLSAWRTMSRSHVGALWGRGALAAAPPSLGCTCPVMSVRAQREEPLLLKTELVCWKSARSQVRNCLSQFGQGN